MLSYFIKKVMRRHDEKNNLKLKSLLREAQLETSALTSVAKGVGNSKPDTLVVSLTSFDKRIDSLHITIESLFQQSLKADHVVLWLSRKNFSQRHLPQILLNMQERGLTIEWVDEDIGPYKKIIYSLARYPDALIVTVDDDVIYPIDTIDMLYQSYLQFPKAIHCHRAYVMKTKTGVLAPYSTWCLATESDLPRTDFFATGIAGVLYPPQALDGEVLNRDLLLELCPFADDIWLKAMSLKAGTKVRKVPDERPWKNRFLTLDGSQESSLKKRNWQKKGGNDEKLAAVFSHYQLYDKLFDGAAE